MATECAHHVSPGAFPRDTVHRTVTIGAFPRGAEEPENARSRRCAVGGAVQVVAWKPAGWLFCLVLY